MTSSIRLYNQAISSFKNIQSELFNKQAQISSGTKANTYAELDSDITTVENFKASASRSESYIRTISNVNIKLDQSFRALDRIIEIASSFKEDLILERSANFKVNDLASHANSSLDSIRGELNSSIGSDFIFAGSKTNIEPVSDLKLQSNYIEGQSTANYYNGDEFISSIDVSSSLRVDYGVTASDSSFRNLIASINRAKDAEANGGVGLEEAASQLDSAIDDLITLQAKIGNNAAIFEESIEFHSRAKVVFEQNIQEKTTPDIIELSIEISQANAVLQASFKNFNDISSLSLLRFLD